MADANECRSKCSVLNGLSEANERSLQESRAFLRERFLRALFAVSNKPCTFGMYEKTEVKAMFRSTDIETTAFQVSNLVTPMGVLPEALIRASDVLTITVAMNCDEQIDLYKHLTANSVCSLPWLSNADWQSKDCRVQTTDLVLDWIIASKSEA